MRFPKGFRPAGEVLSACHSVAPPPFDLHTPTRGARGNGVRYERKVQAYLLERCQEYLPSPWLTYKVAGARKPRWCQPDGLILDVEQGICTIVEIKLQHTAKAYWQMQYLYKPVLEHVLRHHWRFRMLEIVRWFDPTIKFPVRPVMRSSFTAPECGVGVHIWKP